MASETNPRYLAEDEIIKLARSMRVADPTKDHGAFSSVGRMDALIWLRMMNVKGLDPGCPISESEAVEKLKLALWDTQRYVCYHSYLSIISSTPTIVSDRLDYLFPDITLSRSTGKLNISALKSWDGWERPHTELRKWGLEAQKLDGYKDAKRLNS